MVSNGGGILDRRTNRQTEREREEEAAVWQKDKMSRYTLSVKLLNAFHMRNILRGLSRVYIINQKSHYRFDLLRRSSVDED